jgi:hypothetical protein
MTSHFNFAIKSVLFDENYRPAENTRLTTNFANLARGEHRQENLRNALKMIDNRFNALAHWDNPKGDRYGVGLEIISVEIGFGAGTDTFPLIEMLRTSVLDRVTNLRSDGIVGNNFSSYVRDYDFSVVLPEHNKDQPEFSIPPGFGDLHGNLFKAFLNSGAYTSHFGKPPVICISASSSRIYRRAENHHPIMGTEYLQDELSSTDQYFSKMGLNVRFFMPEGSVAPLAFYCAGDLLGDYTNLELISTISTMETFQRIYRPEIYNANSVAGAIYQPSLKHQDYSTTRIVYDREERSRLGVEQGKFAEEHFIKPHKAILDQWSASYAA